MFWIASYATSIDYDNHSPMTMQDWALRIDKFLLSDERDILEDAGKISMEIARDYAETEYEKYRIVQDRLFESDFDKMVLDINGKTDSGKTDSSDRRSRADGCALAKGQPRLMGIFSTMRRHFISQY